MTQNTDVLMRHSSQQEREFQQITSNLRGQGFHLQKRGGDAICGWLVFEEEGRDIAKLQHVRGEWLLSPHSVDIDYRVLFSCLPNCEESYVYPSEERVGIVSPAYDAQRHPEREIPNGTPTPVSGVGVPESDAAHLGEEHWGFGDFGTAIQFYRDGLNELANDDRADPAIAVHLWAASDCATRALDLAP